MTDGRKHPAHHPSLEQDRRPIIVLITVCTHHRKPILASDEACQLLRHAWSEATSWIVGRFVLLPDHLHLFCAPAEQNRRSVAQWVGYWKRIVTQRWQDKNALPIWQENFWDRQLRSDEHYHTRWEYVRNNPVRHSLVAHADLWKWQGEMNFLPW